jgi:Fe-S-cluster containining protein
MRNCDDCAVCCTGILSGESYGKEYYLNHPCHYLQDKLCTIYDNRPTVCKNYRCAWLDDESIPDHLDPRITNSLLMKTREELRVFMDSVDSPHEPAFIEFANTNNIKLVIYVGQDPIKVINNDAQVSS